MKLVSFCKDKNLLKSIYLPTHGSLHVNLHVSLKFPIVLDEQEISSTSSSIIVHEALHTSSVLYPLAVPNAIIFEQEFRFEGKLHVNGTLSLHSEKQYHCISFCISLHLLSQLS